MAMYEILIRGLPDGTIQGASISDYVVKGMDTKGGEIHDVSPPRPIDLKDLANILTNNTATLTAQVVALTAERDTLSSEVEPLKEQIRALKGVPKFNASDLLKQLTDAEKEHITKFVASDDRLRPLWAAFLTRVTGAPIPIDSQTFLAALAGLTAALGDTRIAELFAAINIDIKVGSYIEPTQAR